MAKGDYVRVKSEIGGALNTNDIKVAGAGGEVTTKWEKERLVIEVLGRTGKTRQRFTYALSAVRSVEEVRRDDD